MSGELDQNRGEAAAELLEIGANDIHQFFRTLTALGLAGNLGIREVVFDVLFHHFDHQSIHGTAHSRDLLQYFRAAELGLERALQSLDLTPDAPHPSQKLVFSPSCMTHGMSPQILYGGIVSEARWRRTGPGYGISGGPDLH